ncbi:phospholipase C [Humibacter ginsenosidimutans]|uniref:Alkaline phosphatase family protein n=1 Tax=Humibacter ginsenosidimutans TaxID=2599293 RepID=A0A5B8M6Q4_9MICO|nr:alkaline phosphatase family protein [Humibacter ginsenosidimutans]QDZ16026.1 alkaline phosphatase family protein [Humibacter ginsenosidimutans]
MPTVFGRRTLRVAALPIALAAIATTVAIAAPASAHQDNHSTDTKTPIKHLVVLFDENISFDHYFGTYPNAANTDGTKFVAAKGTPKANTEQSAGLITTNPNAYSPQRLSPSEAVTCDQNHNYGPEQKAVDNGAMDKFVENTSKDTCTGMYGSPGLAMDYYDGNTVTGLWNYAQNYAMSDNAWDTVFGPSTPGALDLISGQTHGVVSIDPTTGKQTATPDAYTVASPDAKGVGTVINDPDPAYDDCADNNHTSTNALASLSGKNIGDLLNAKNITWGWFQGGFTPTTTWNGKTGSYATCGATTTNVAGAASVDYSPHHNPFEYYKSTSNPHHLPPSSDRMIGHTDQANHQYDLTAFDTALKQNNLPAVSFLKAPEAQDGHAGYSDPLDEQKFLVNEINAIQKSPEWKSTAIVINYDDSDGWYDHVAPTILNGSKDAANDSTVCTTAKASAAGGYADRCGPSQRLPFLVISPFSKQNYVDHTAIEQTSITKFIEDNWSTGRLGDSSFDQRAGSITSMFDFAHPQQRAVLLGSNGAVSKVVPVRVTGYGNGNQGGNGQGGHGSQGGNGNHQGGHGHHS